MTRANLVSGQNHRMGPISDPSLCAACSVALTGLKLRPSGCWIHKAWSIRPVGHVDGLCQWLSLVKAITSPGICGGIAAAHFVTIESCSPARVCTCTQAARTSIGSVSAYSKQDETGIGWGAPATDRPANSMREDDRPANKLDDTAATGCPRPEPARTTITTSAIDTCGPADDDCNGTSRGGDRGKRDRRSISKTRVTSAPSGSGVIAGHIAPCITRT